MAKMVDMEGCTLPPDNDLKEVFDLVLLGVEPLLMLDVPMLFHVPSETGEINEYNGCGGISVPLRKVLQEYIGEDHESRDGGESLPIVEAMLREYADKITALRANTR